MMRGLARHSLTTVKLNFRSPAALVYGYLVPIFFLIAFASVFRSGQPRLTHEMGMLLTITALGGACFGMPTAMVAERERGVWRRYQLLPAATGAIVISTMLARVLLIASAGLLQIALARWIYGTPLPVHPLGLAGAFILVAFAFESLGLIIAMLADSVPAVQALGQCIFLPMILIGGVGVPLELLPNWAAELAGYFPGRYAVELLQDGVSGVDRLNDVLFSIIALLVIGAAGCVTGAKLFRWDAGRKVSARSKGWIVIALAAWAGVGIAAHIVGADTTRISNATDATTTKSTLGWESITIAEENAVRYDDLEDDSSFITPLVNSPQDIGVAEREWIGQFRTKLAAWPPAQSSDLEQRTGKMLSLAAIGDVARDPHEAEIPYVVFEQLRAGIPSESLAKILTWIINHPREDAILTSANDLGIPGPAPEQDVRNRTTQYAKKLLERVLDKLPASH